MIRCSGYRQVPDVPGWIAERIAEFARTDSVPLAPLGEAASEWALDAWIESLALAHGVGQRVLLRTGMRFFPWLEYWLPASGWAAAARGVLGQDLVLAQDADGEALLVVFAEEYAYQAFAARRPPPSAAQA